MKPHDRTLAGQVAVISGGAGDIGRAIAKNLHASGARIALGDLQPAHAVRRRLAGHHYTEVDVADPAAVEAWLAQVAREIGPPTLIIPNAAIVEIGCSLDLSIAAWRRTLDVNLTGAFVLAQLAAKQLVATHRHGRIVFVGSWAAHAPHPNLVAYSAAKAGLRMAMQCLALELAHHGILVNEVAPGRVDAGLSKRLFDETPGFRERAREGVPLHALLTPDDVANGVAYLCHPDTRHATGSVLLLDGGLSLVRPV